MKIIPTLLWLVLSCAAAQAQFAYTTENGTVTITGYDCTSGAVTIPDTLDGLPVTGIGERAFSGCARLTRVTIPSSVTSIGVFAFWRCPRLTRVTIPESVTLIGWSAFSGCTTLVSVTIPSSATSIEGYAFSGCPSLTAIEVGRLNPTYRSLEGVLFNKSQDTLIQYPGGRAGSYRIPDSVIWLAGAAFHGCTHLNSVIIPGSMTRIGVYTFRDCPNLTGVCFEGDAPDPEYGGWVQEAGWDIPAAIVYYRAGATGWGPNFADRPTALWISPPVYAEWWGTTSRPAQYPEASSEADDPDQDHLSNYAEMLAGTDPADLASVLLLERQPRPDDLTAADQTPLGAAQHAVYVRSVQGKTYGVQWAESSTGHWHIDAVVTATTKQMRFVFDRPTSQSFYRVVLAQ